MSTLVAVPVYNEQKYVSHVLRKILRFAPDVLAIDDGSTDETPLLLARQPVEVIRHARNRGYGQSLIDAFRWANCYGFQWLITMDCDEQHEPEGLPDFFRAIYDADRASPGVDVISGSRYLPQSVGDDRPPPDRQAINRTITRLINEKLKFGITDSFCGFKAYRVSAINRLNLTEKGYAFPLQFWVQAYAEGLTIKEIPVRLIYNDPNRSFGGPLDDSDHRRSHYLSVFERELAMLETAGENVECAGCGGNGRNRSNAQHSAGEPPLA
ncbi:MAG: glycosyltransferase family 2 protein [Phycisphaeraceae bacterium]|nr:glycosyltransferase family 2 protein [Phycisphaeraceae bacterium]